MKSRFIILYKTGKYETMKYLPRKLSSNIYMILVPLSINRDLYLPLRPSRLLDFSKVVIHLGHSIYAYDYEDDHGEDIFHTEYNVTCIDIKSYADALFNLFKFSGTSSFIADYVESGITVNFLNYATNMTIEFYNIKNELIEKYNTKKVKSIDEELNSHTDALHYERYPTDIVDIYSRIEFIDDLVVINKKSTSYGLLLYEGNKWKEVTKDKLKSRSLSESDKLLLDMNDFYIYYLTDPTICLKLDKYGRELRKASIKIFCCPILDETAKSYVNDKHIIPTRFDKLKWKDGIENGDLFSPLNLYVDIIDAKSYFITFLLFKIILTYLNYFIAMSFANETKSPVKCITFAQFKATGNILDISECDTENLTKEFLEMI